MAIIYKRSTGRLAVSTQVWIGPCWYYGFTGLPGGANRTVIIYDSAAGPAGTIVEDAIIDGNKTFDGHSHSIPIFCNNGLYVAITGGSVNVFLKPSAMA